MTPKSAKAKGRALQNYVRDEILTSYPELTHDDCKPAIMGESGEDIKLSALGKQVFPFSLECKNQEVLAPVWKAFTQCENNAEDRTAILVIKKARSSPLAIVDFEWLITNLPNLTKKKRHEL